MFILSCYKGGDDTAPCVCLAAEPPSTVSEFIESTNDSLEGGKARKVFTDGRRDNLANSVEPP
jgi:hypothetical protein